MTKLVSLFGFAGLMCLALAGSAYAQAVEGQSFYATPMSHGGISSANMQVETAGPPPAPPPMAAPPPPMKRHGRRHKKAM